MSGTDESVTDRLSRRKTLAAVAGAGGIALAGCTGKEKNNGGDSSSGDGSSGASVNAAPPTPPSKPPDNQYWQYVVDSLEYQNEMLQALANE
jgi:hypothetical protein